MLDLQAIRARAEAATPGEWVYDAGEIFRVEPKSKHGPTSIVYAQPNEGGGVERDEDGIFIAAARSDIPALCDEVESLRKRVRELEHFGGHRDSPICSCASCRLLPPLEAE